MSFIESNNIRDLFEIVEDRCQAFLADVKESTPFADAENKFKEIVAGVSEIVRTGADEEPLMLEIANSVVRGTQQELCARVGVTKDGTLLLMLTPIGCDNQHLMDTGHEAKEVSIQELSSMGFTPTKMVTNLAMFSNQVLIDTMVTMPGGNA